MNIINTHDEQYNLTLYLKDGGIVSAENQRLDLFSRDTKCVYMRDMKGRYAVEVEFDISESIYDPAVIPLYCREKPSSYMMIPKITPKNRIMSRIT